MGGKKKINKNPLLFDKKNCPDYSTQTASLVPGYSFINQTAKGREKTMQL